MSGATRTSTASPALSLGSVPSVLKWFTFVLSILGLGVSLYLSYEHATGSTTLACSDTGKVNCLKVTTSTYSVILGIPVAYLGALFFIGAVVLMFPKVWDLPRREIVWARWASVGVGLVFVLYLVYAELYEVGSICLWCTSVHIITFLLFVSVLFAEALRE